MNLKKQPFFHVLVSAVINETAIRTLVGIAVAAAVAQWNFLGEYSDALAAMIAAFVMAIAGLIEWRKVPSVVAQNRRPVVVGVGLLVDLFEAKSGYDIPEDVERALLAKLDAELAEIAKKASNGGVGSTLS